MIFRNENLPLGPSTTIQELSGFGSGNPVANNFKPVSREIVGVPALSAANSPAAAFIFVAPWKCQVLSVKATFTVAGGAAAALDIAKFTQAGLPQAPSTAPNGSTVVDQLSATIPLTGAANTTLVGSLSTAAGLPAILNAGDQLAYNLTGTLTGLVGLLVQVEIAQIG